MRKISLLILTIFVFACVSNKPVEKPIIAVSIAPLGFIVEQIVDTTYDVIITVPETTSPETYEMTAKQMAQISDAEFYFATGLIDFEQSLGTKIESVAPNTQYVNLSNDMNLLQGTCGHNHSGEDTHNHLVDPHIWLSPSLMKQIANQVVELLVEKNPNIAELYKQNLTVLVAKIDSLDIALKSKFDSCDNKSFAIVHPSLTYFANDYGLQQISIEQDGKEPSVQKIKQLSDDLKAKNIKFILYSRQSPNATALQISEQIGAEVVEYDPLKKEWFDNIEYLSNVLCN